MSKPNEKDKLSAPVPRARFCYWGRHARLVLPDGFPVVELEYLTEPPHGDFLYLLLRRDIQLSLCSRFLAITSLHAHGSNAMAFHVVDLMERKIWSRSGFADLLSNYGEATQVPLRTDEWASYVRS